MLIYDLVVLAQQSYFLEYNNIKYVEVLERLIKITKKFRALIFIALHHLQTDEKQLVVYGQKYMFYKSYQPKFYLFHKYIFNISITAVLQLRILQNSFFAKHLPLTAFDLYDSGLEYIFSLQNIFCANEEAIFPASFLFFLSLAKTGQALFDDCKLLSAH